jgi:phosphate/sulfate permease
MTDPNKPMNPDENDISILWDYLNIIALFLLLGLLITLGFSWFSTYEKSLAVSNTGAVIGILLAAYAARTAINRKDKLLIVLSLSVTFISQAAALYFAA